MRIVLAVHMFLPRNSAGTEVLTCEIARRLLARGHQVHVVTADTIEPMPATREEAKVYAAEKAAAKASAPMSVHPAPAPQAAAPISTVPVAPR